MNSISIPRDSRDMLIRFGGYVLVMLVMMGLITLDAYGFSRRGFGEVSWVEISQLVFLLVSALICARVYRMGVFRNAALLLFGFFMASFIRENDGVLDVLVYPGSWKFFAFPLIAFVLWMTWRRRVEFAGELIEYFPTLSCGFFVSGFLTTYVFSRFFGRGFLWESIMGEGYMRIAKDAAEECTELLGYTLLLCAMIELLAMARRRRANSRENMVS